MEPLAALQPENPKACDQLCALRSLIQRWQCIGSSVFQKKMAPERRIEMEMAFL